MFGIKLVEGLKCAAAYEAKYECYVAVFPVFYTCTPLANWKFTISSI